MSEALVIPPPHIVGLVYGMPQDIYHGPEIGRAYVSRSGLMDLAKSPAHFYGTRLDPRRPPAPAPTDAMVLGTMTHCAVLEPAEFSNRYAVAPKCDRRTKEGKAMWAAFCDGLKEGQEAADAEMVQQALSMAVAVRENGAIAALLDEGDAEVSAFTLHDGVPVRVRPDFVSPAGGNTVILTDLKTTKDASPQAFARTVANAGYALQAALYSDVYEQASGKHVSGFVLAAVEKEWPFATAAYMLDEASLSAGRRKYKRLLALYAECMRTQTWPGYTSGREIQLLQLPAWAQE